MLDVSVRSKKFNCNFSLEGKYSILIGDSGKGKSLLVKALTDLSGAYVVNSSLSGINFIELHENNYSLMLANSNDTSLFIVDDKDFIFQKEFNALCSSHKNSYFLFVIRTECSIDRLAKWNGLSVRADDVFEFVSNGKDHSFKRATELLNSRKPPELLREEIQLSLCEDEGSGLEFFSKIFKNTVTNKGKGNVISYILNNLDTFRNSTIYLVVDNAAMGLRLKSILSILSNINCKVYMSQHYESFEYMLLRSNMFGISKSELMTNILQYSSFEELCTDTLKSISTGKNYSYSKSKLSKCYTENCCNMDRSKIMCDKGIPGDKVLGLFIGTEFEFLAYLRQV